MLSCMHAYTHYDELLNFAQPVSHTLIYNRHNIYKLEWINGNDRDNS